MVLSRSLWFEQLSFPKCLLINTLRIVRFHVVSLEVLRFPIRTTHEIQHFDFAKLSGMTFCLERNVALSQKFARALCEYRALNVASKLWT